MASSNKYEVATLPRGVYEYQLGLTGAQLASRLRDCPAAPPRAGLRIFVYGRLSDSGQTIRFDIRQIPNLGLRGVKAFRCPMIPCPVGDAWRTRTYQHPHRRRCQRAQGVVADGLPPSPEHPTLWVVIGDRDVGSLPPDGPAPWFMARSATADAGWQDLVSVPALARQPAAAAAPATAAPAAAPAQAATVPPVSVAATAATNTAAIAPPAEAAAASTPAAAPSGDSGVEEASSEDTQPSPPLSPMDIDIDDDDGDRDHDDDSDSDHDDDGDSDYDDGSDDDDYDDDQDGDFDDMPLPYAPWPFDEPAPWEAPHPAFPDDSRWSW